MSVGVRRSALNFLTKLLGVDIYEHQEHSIDVWKELLGLCDALVKAHFVCPEEQTHILDECSKSGRDGRYLWDLSFISEVDDVPIVKAGLPPFAVYTK